MKTKKYYADRVISALQNAYPNIDFKIQEREVFLVIDDIVNSLAKANFFENWKFGNQMIDEQYTTTWDGDAAITVVSPVNQLSYIELPANYAALPMNRGIEEVWSLNYEYGSVKIIQHRDLRLYKNNMAGNLQKQLGGYPQGTRFYFSETQVDKNYSSRFGVRLVIRDSSQISLTSPYPIPSSAEEEVIGKAIIYFMNKRLQPTDTIRDGNDALKRN